MSSTRPVGVDTPGAVSIVFRTGGTDVSTNAVIGETLLDTAHRNDVGLEGACEGNLACSTCHVILENGIYKRLGEPSDREYDLLEQAFGATATSRLGCQLRIDKTFDKSVFTIPRATRNMAVDGFKPKPH